MKEKINKLLSLYGVTKYYFKLRRELKENIECYDKCNMDNFSPWEAHYKLDSFSWKAVSGAHIEDKYEFRNGLTIKDKFLVVKEIIGNFFGTPAYKRYES